MCILHVKNKNKMHIAFMKFNKKKCKTGFVFLVISLYIFLMCLLKYYKRINIQTAAGAQGPQHSGSP